MYKLRAHLLATAATVALSGAAYAADLHVRPPLQAPVPFVAPFIHDWQGSYFGGTVGVGLHTSEYNDGDDESFLLPNHVWQGFGVERWSDWRIQLAIQIVCLGR